MAENLKSKILNIPKSPGVYQFLDKNGGVIYVGKAKNLRARVRQYFGDDDSRPQIPFLMAEAADVNYTVVSNELESAFLENTIIKQYRPKYNIDLKDDKNYAFITIDYSTEIPQIGYRRKIEDQPSYQPPLNPPLARGGGKGRRTKDSEHSDKIRRFGSVKYFGPYSAAYKIKNTLNLVRKIFPFCAATKVSSRPCFYFYMHRCPGVCVEKITIGEYYQQLNKIIKFLKGDITSILKEIKTEMAAASAAKKFETAARLRDQLRSLEILQERQNVILPKKVDWDIVSLATSDGYACVNLFKIREGKMFDKENFVYELPDPDLQMESGFADNYGSKIIQRFLEQYYLETSFAPKCIYLQNPASDSKLVENIIQSRFHRKTEIGIPQKGKTKQLVDLGKINAEEHLKNWLADKAGHLDKINKALEQLKELLNLPQIPKRIECYDISNIQGTNPVGSMVVFVDGLPAKSQYRKFKIQGKNSPDDFAMMREMLARRMARLPADVGASFSRPSGDGGGASAAPTTEKNVWPLPDLIVIDGGKGQLSAALAAIRPPTSDLRPPMIGLAKRVEEIFLPNQPDPIILSHDQPALQLLQRLRDEAHRFGIIFHRKLRSKAAVKSALDTIAGVGPKTKKLLKQKFGTVEEIKKAGLQQLAEVVGIKLAEIIKKFI